MKHERHSTYHYCTLCDYYTPKSTALSMHLAIKHSNKKNHACNLCSQKFYTNSQLRHHKLSKHTDSELPCFVASCTKKFKNDGNRRMHYVRKHMDRKLLMRPCNGDWKCLHCGKIQPRNSMLYHVIKCNPLVPSEKNYKEIFNNPDPMCMECDSYDFFDTDLFDKDLFDTDMPDFHDHDMPMNLVDSCIEANCARTDEEKDCEMNPEDEEIYNLLREIL